MKGASYLSIEIRIKNEFCKALNKKIHVQYLIREVLEKNTFAMQRISAKRCLDAENTNKCSECPINKLR